MLLFFAQDETAASGAADQANAAGDAVNNADQAASAEPLQLDMATVVDWLIANGPKVGFGILILIIAWILGGWLRRAVRKGTQKAKMDLTLAKFLSNLAKWGMIAIGALIALPLIGFEVAGFAALFAAVGFAIGFALQGTLGDLAAGVLLLIQRPFRVGDLVKIGGEMCIVDEINLFFTTADTFDGRRLIVPNGNISGTTIENITHHPQRRVDVAVGVEYSANIDETRRVLESAIQTVERRLEDPAPAVVLLELASSSVNWSVRIWAKQEDFGDVKQATIRAVKVALDNAEIGIPFPQMDVHLDQLETSAR